VQLVEPVDYLTMAWLLRRATLCVTDSGGLQEEAPQLRLPVMVTRVATERPEAVEAGGAVVVGYDKAAIVDTADRWLRDPTSLEAARPTRNPFGDGRAGLRCVAALRRRLGLPGPEIEPWVP
jgi:UDP-N-acetylglucosamine 2-epimerase (non-hydrolysing)